MSGLGDLKDVLIKQGRLRPIAFKALSHINTTYLSAFYYLYNMRRIRKYLSRWVTESLVHAFITSRVTVYRMTFRFHISWNFNGYGMPQLGWSLEHPRFRHVTPLLFRLHWLPISYRIKFRILLLTFKCLYGLAPNYLIDLVTIKKQSRYSNESIFLELPGIKTRPTLGDRAFQSAALDLWNALTLLRLPLKLIF